MDGEIEFSINLSDKLKILKARLRDSDKAIRLAFLAATRAAVLPLRQAVIASAEEKLPRSGGFAARVANSKFATRNKTMSTIVQIVNPIDLKQIDDGSLRHPVFGRINSWIDPPQKINPHFWTEPTEALRPVVSAEINKAMDIAFREIGDIG